jgi:hypothetical protein
MIKADEISNPSSCLNKALDHEPVFVLLGRDALAPETIRYWANERVRSWRNTYNDEQIKGAFALADQMEEWRRQKSQEWAKG